jgi:hypothetical protein
MTAEERRKASGPAYRAAAAPAHRGAATGWCAVRRSASLFGEQRRLGELKTSPPVRSRQAFLESVTEEPDAKRIAGMQFRVVIAGLPVMTRGCVAV